jgi:hypothetical protein
MTRSNKKSKSKIQQRNIEVTEYKKNDIVSYINSDGTKSQVKIIGIHYDTPPDTYYTIEFSDGKHKQTIRERLSN